MSGDMRSSELALIVTNAVNEAMDKHAAQHQQLIKELHDTNTEFRVVSERLRQVTVLAEAHDRILRGNGKAGVVTRLDNIEPLVHEHQDALRGSNDDHGLIARVSQLEKSQSKLQESVSKPAWAVITTMISAVVAWVVSQVLR